MFVESYFIGSASTIPSTISGMMIAAATHTLGASMESLNKHIIKPMIAVIITANIPGPTPNISPL